MKKKRNLLYTSFSQGMNFAIILQADWNLLRKMFRELTCEWTHTMLTLQGPRLYDNQVTVMFSSEDKFILVNLAGFIIIILSFSLWVK